MLLHEKCLAARWRKTGESRIALPRQSAVEGKQGLGRLRRCGQVCKGKKAQRSRPKPRASAASGGSHGIVEANNPGSD
jgi:hypothetical protein